MAVKVAEETRGVVSSDNPRDLCPSSSGSGGCHKTTRGHPSVTEGRVRRRFQRKTKSTKTKKQYQNLKSMVPSLANQDEVSKIDVVNHTTDYIRKLESTLLAQLITQQRQAEQQQLQPGGTLAAKMNIHPGTASSNPEELLKIIRERVKNIVLESKKNKKAEEGEHIASLDQVRRKQMTIVAAPLTTEEEPPSSSNEV